MRHTIIALFLAAMTVLGASAPFACLDDTDTHTTFEFTTPDYTLTPDADGVRIDLGDDWPPYGAGLPGTPDIPVFSRLVRIPAGVSVELLVETIDEETTGGVQLLPCRDLDALDAGNTGYAYDAEAYASSELYPAQSAILGETGVMRDAVLARVTLQPFRYNAAEQQLSVARRIRVTLNYTQDSRGLTPRLANRNGEAFGELVNSVTLNPRTNTRSYNEPGSYIYIYSSDNGVMQWLQLLVDWRERQGYEVHLVSTDDVGNSANQIKSYIQSAYNNWDNPPEYVCLVGDASINFIVPTFYEFYEDQVYGDHPYSLLDGDDSFPDVLVGRLPFNSLTELQTMVMKILHYEIDPPTDHNWLDRSLLVGDPYDSGVSTILTMMYIQGLLQDYNPAGDIILVSQNPLVTQMRDGLNSGVGAFFYRGFGSFTNWSPEYTQALTNYDMTPFMSAITCYTGTFANPEDSAIEVFLKAGTPSSRIGAVGVIGSSSATHTCFNNIITGGIAEGIYVEGMRSFAAALDRGKLALYESYPTNPNDFVDWYTIGKNLLGDPGCWLRTHQADSVFVTAPATVSLGAHSFMVHTAYDNGQPMGNVWVTARAGDNVASAWTNSSGDAVIYFDASTAGEVLLTASKPNTVPWLGSFTVVQTTDFLTFESIDANAALWAGDHVIDVCMRNTGSNNIPGASAVVRIDDPFFTLGDSLLNFGAIAAGQTGWSTNAFGGTLSPHTPGGHVIDVELVVSTGWDPYSVWFEMPVDMASGELSWTFSSPGPGDSGTLDLTFANTSPHLLSAAVATVECLSPEVTITSGVANFPSIPAGQAATAQSAVTFDLDAGYVPGAPLTFIVTMEEQPKLYQVVHITDITFGTNLPNIPTGPDSYGYWIYDSGDTGYADSPTYNWVEIDPAAGGQGTSHAVTDNDYDGSGDVVHLDLPFSFRFYEISYDQISISTNGFIMPGDHFNIDWMNFPIPGPMVPRPIIAPFWDDLIVGANSHLCTWYDAANHCVIVEWRNFLNRYDNSEETFQVMLYDQEYNATYLGDSKILFQYQTVNNVDQGTYQGFALDHGEYATVGVGDNSGQRGLEYTFSNMYAPGATQLDDGLALMVSGPPSPPSSPYVVLGDMTLDDSAGNNNGLIDSDETIELTFVLRNLGLETATGVTAQMIEDDPYIVLTQDISEYPDIDGGQSATGDSNFIIDVADNCPNDHYMNLMLRITTDTGVRDVAMHFRTYAPDAMYIGCNFEDGNDNQLAPGESGELSCLFERQSYHNLEDAVVSFASEQEGVTFSPASVTLGDITDEQFTASCQLSASEDIANGTDIEIAVTLTHDGVFSRTTMVPFVVGVMEQLVFDDFNDGFDTDFWNIIDCDLGSENLAGGDGSEALFVGDTVQQLLLVSDVQPPADIMKFIFEFDHRNIGTGAIYGVLLQDMMTGETFIPWINNADMAQSEHRTVEYNVLGGLPNEWVLILLLNPTEPGNEQQWAVDNFDAKYIRHDPAYITGYVTLDGGPGDVEDTMVMISGLISTHPDETGYYELEVIEGVYDVVYALAGYSTHTEENVVVAYDNMPNIDVTLEYLPGPTNLSYLLEDDVISLTWEFNGETYTRKADLSQRDTQQQLRTPDFDYFDITLRYRYNFYYHSYTEETDYTRSIISSGNYEFWVQARYVGSAISAESNHVSFDVEGVGEDPPLYTFGLEQNSPNPFNPETVIAFSLASDAVDCRIDVYNIRGERVRCLANGPREAGKHTVVWDGRDDNGASTASGVYFYRLTAGRETAVRKAVLLK